MPPSFYHSLGQIKEKKKKKKKKGKTEREEAAVARRPGRGVAGHRPRGRRRSLVARRPPGRAGGKAGGGLLPTERIREGEKREKRERRY